MATANGVAETTDAEGVILTLRERGIPCATTRGRHRLRRLRARDGGGARSGRRRRHARQSRTRARIARGRPAAPAVHAAQRFSGDGFSIVVNATPVGRDSDEISFPIDGLKRDAVIVDLVYRDSRRR